MGLTERSFLERMELMGFKPSIAATNADRKMTEVKIGVNDFGTLFAIFPTGEVRTILVDVLDTEDYWTLLVGNVPVPPEEETK